ncbi:MAG TPA: MBL fold metallo-hydrolase, partial [Stellaceae bacterium]
DLVVGTARPSLRLAYALETHVHADHVTGAWLLKQRTGCRIALAAKTGAEGADRYLVQDDVVAFGDRNLQVRQTPGHTGGSRIRTVGTAVKEGVSADVCELADLVLLNPGEELAHGPVIGQAGVFIADIDGEEFEGPARAMIAGVGNRRRHRERTAQGRRRPRGH